MTHEITVECCVRGRGSIVYDELEDRFFLVVKGFIGGKGYIEIDYCPWCGERLSIHNAEDDHLGRIIDALNGRKIEGL